MNVDFMKSCIAVALSALLAYACYEICDYKRVQWVITIGAFLTLVIPAILAMGISVKAEKIVTILSIFSWVVLFIEVLINGVFVFFDFEIPTYVIINGFVLLIYALIYSSVYKKRL